MLDFYKQVSQDKRAKYHREAEQERIAKPISKQDRVIPKWLALLRV